MKLFETIFIGDRVVGLDDVIAGLTWQFWLMVAVVLLLLGVAFTLLWRRHRDAVDALAELAEAGFTLRTYRDFQREFDNHRDTSIERNGIIGGLQLEMAEKDAAHSAQIASLHAQIDHRRIGLRVAAEQLGIDDTGDSTVAVVRNSYAHGGGIATRWSGDRTALSRYLYGIIRDPSRFNNMPAGERPILPELTFLLVRSAIGTLHVLSVKPSADDERKPVITPVQRVDRLPLGDGFAQICEPFCESSELLEVLCKLMLDMLRVAAPIENDSRTPKSHTFVVGETLSYTFFVDANGRINVLEAERSS